jgi:hypothetical protein
MQYIQLQGQVAATLDTPLEGGFNLFIDTADGTIKAKDSEGNLTGGGNSLTELTKTQLDDAIDGGDLTPGAFYKITGVSSGSNERYIQEGGTTVILQAATTSSLNSKGVGLFWNPDYDEYNVWTNTFEFVMDRYVTGEFFDMEETILLEAPCNAVLRPNIFENRMIATITDSEVASYFTGSVNYPIPFEGDNTGISGSLTSVSSFPSFNVGNKVIWGGRVWVNLNGELGSDDGQWTIEGPEWALVPYSSADYNLVADIIEYDYVNDMICYRKDVVHNVEVTSNYEHVNDDGDRNGIRQFPWGHPQVYGVTLENTDTQNLVNFPNTNRINELHMKHSSRFEANYWGSNSGFYDIFGDCDSDIENLSLGKYVDFTRIRLGINSTIGGESSLYIVGNDGTTISDITMGTNCEIYGMNMYQYARLDNITMEMDADIYNINMYNDSSIQDLDMSMASRLYDISMGDSSEIYDITLDADAYLADVNMNSDSQIYRNHLGRSSYMDYLLLEDDCSMYNITLGLDSSINCINLYNNGGYSSNMNSISLGDNSGVSNISLYGSTYISNINGLTNAGFGQLSVTGSDAFISYIELGQDAGFGGFSVDSTVNGDAYLEYIKIGQGDGLGDNVTTIIENVTIERGFNNYNASKLIAGVTASFDPGFTWADISNINPLDTNKSFQILDTTGWDASTTTLNYYLPNGDWDGQTIKFFMTDDGTGIYDNPSNLHIWLYSFTAAFDLSDTHTQQPWYPFVRTEGGRRSDIPQCIWINGKWVIDNDQWD